MNALKRYFETHLSIKADQMRRAQEISVSSHYPSISQNKPIRLSAMQIAENIDTMFEYMPFKSRWSPVDNFIQLGGVVKCFQVTIYVFSNARPRALGVLMQIYCFYRN